MVEYFLIIDPLDRYVLLARVPGKPAFYMPVMAIVAAMSDVYQKSTHEALKKMRVMWSRE